MPARRTTTLLTAALLPLALTGCGVGLQAQTYKARTTQDATNANVGDLALRDVAILPPDAGESELGVGKRALATLSVISVSRDKDSLTSVSTAVATSVELVDRTGHPVMSVEIPALGSLGPSDFGLVLHGLTKALRPGMYIEMTFAFEKNGRATFKVPVKTYDSPVPRDSFSPKPAQE